MAPNTEVIIRHIFIHLLFHHKINTLDISERPTSQEEEEILKIIESHIEEIYSLYGEHIQNRTQLLKQTFERLLDCLNFIFHQSLSYEMKWNQLILCMIYVVEAMVLYMKKDSAENTLDFTWDILCENFTYLDVWIQKQGGWANLKDK